jgi:hypothetical protein
MPEIQSAVGKQPALNAVRDQKVVQDLLNKISADKGGPLTPLIEPFRPNFVSRSLQEAIIRFQNQNVDPQNRDGRVDHVGQTIRKLNELAGSPSTPAPVVAKKTTFHSKPLAPKGANPPLPPELHPQVVQEVTHKENQGATYRQKIREQLIGNPNALAVENFLNSRPKSPTTGLPVLEASFVFGDVEVSNKSGTTHNGTALTTGSRVFTSAGNDSRPVILFSDADGAVVLGPSTMVVVLAKKTPAPKSVETTLVKNDGSLQRFIGGLAGTKKNNDIPLN